MSGALSHIDTLMVDWSDDLKDGMQRRAQVQIRIRDGIAVSLFVDDETSRLV